MVDMIPETETNVLSIDELVIAVRKLTDTTLHSHPLCQPSPSNYYCLCPVGRIRSALPRCGYILTTDNGPTYYCVDISHPDRPTTHTMEKL